MLENIQLYIFYLKQLKNITIFLFLNILNWEKKMNNKNKILVK